MRNLVLSLCLGASTLMVTPQAAAQSERAQFEVAYEAHETRRRAIVAQSLELTEEEADKFWPLYDEYRAGMKSISLRQKETLATFAEKFRDLDNETAGELLTKALATNADLAKLRQDHIKKARRVLEAGDALRYFQIDDYIETAERASVQRQIPLAGTDLEALYRQQAAMQQQ